MQTNFKIFGENKVRQLSLDGRWAECKNWEITGKGIWQLLRAKEITEEYAAYLLNTIIDYDNNHSHRANAVKYWLKVYCIPTEEKIERCIYLYLSDINWQVSVMAWNYLKGKIGFEKEMELEDICGAREGF